MILLFKWYSILSVKFSTLFNRHSIEAVLVKHAQAILITSRRVRSIEQQQKHRYYSDIITKHSVFIAIVFHIQLHFFKSIIYKQLPGTRTRK